MSLVMIIYLIDIVGNIGCFTTAAVIITSIAAASLAFFWFIGIAHDIEKENKDALFKWSKINFIAAIIIGCIGCFIPSKQTMYMMVGASAAKEIVDNPKVQAVGGKVFDLINKKLDELTEGKK